MRDNLFRRINDDIIDYLNEPLDGGSVEQLNDAMVALCELLKENLEWYCDNAGASVSIKIIRDR